MLTPFVAHANPSTPQTFRYEIYSDTTVELFWTRSSSHPRVTGYELTKDGTVLGVFDALSYMEYDLSPGITHLYSITAIDNRGDRSAVRSLSVRIPSSPAQQIADLQQEISDLREQLSQTISTDFPGPVIATGETISVQFGDDGDWQSGVTVSGERFQNNNDGTFLDRLTGLTWLSDLGCIVKRNWSEGVQYANTLADDGTICPDLTDGSAAGDWRLPNFNELQSLADKSKVSPALVDGIPSQGRWSENPFSPFWTSTSFGPAPELRAWVIVQDYGSSYHTNKDNVHFIWPVKN